MGNGTFECERREHTAKKSAVLQFKTQSGGEVAWVSGLQGRMRVHLQGVLVYNRSPRRGGTPRRIFPTLGIKKGGKAERRCHSTFRENRRRIAG